MKVFTKARFSTCKITPKLPPTHTHPNYPGHNSSSKPKLPISYQHFKITPPNPQNKNYPQSKITRSLSYPGLIITPKYHIQNYPRIAITLASQKIQRTHAQKKKN